MDIYLLNNKRTMHKLIFKVNYNWELKKNKLINRVKKLCKNFEYSLENMLSDSLGQSETCIW